MTLVAVRVAVKIEGVMKNQLSRGFTAVGISAVLVIGVGGFAYGATGGSFLLGKSNKAGGSTSLTNTGSGVALKLFTKSSLSAPFSTNAKGRVVNLYADRANTANAAANSTRLGGQTLSQVLASVQPVALTCAQGGACVIGDTGPGNGKVFYDAGSMQSWGRYLEAAPESWNKSALDPAMKWCSTGGAQDGIPVRSAVGTAIGTGWMNTERMALKCDYGSAVSARWYQGGGKRDWFVPSVDELYALWLAKDIVGGFSANSYWTSTQPSLDIAVEALAEAINFQSGGTESVEKRILLGVRPIRTF